MTDPWGFVLAFIVPPAALVALGLAAVIHFESQLSDEDKAASPHMRTLLEKVLRRTDSVRIVPGFGCIYRVTTRTWRLLGVPVWATSRMERR